MGTDQADRLILCVEDHQGFVDLIRDSLSEFKIKFASNYDDATRLLEEHRFSMILLDNSLAGDKTGFDVCRYIRERGIRTPVFMITLAKQITHDDVREVGGDGLIRKDIDFIPVLKTITDTVVGREGER
jgi:CheY-like chemotaxis protein